MDMLDICNENAMLDEIARMYRYNWDLKYIAEEMEMSMNELYNNIEKLRAREVEIHPGGQIRMSEWFKNVIIDRLKNGGDGTEIVSDMKISRTTLCTWKKKYGIQPEKKTEQYIHINWDSHYICPTCNSKRIRKIFSSYDGSDSTRARYCLECSTEWFGEVGSMKMINWEFFE